MKSKSLLFGMLYFAQSIPSGFFAFALLYRLYEMGWTTGQGGSLLAAMSIPWMLKPLIAPFIDRYGRKIIWAICSAFVTAVAVLLLSFLPISFTAVLAVALITSTARAFQDVAVDSYAIDIAASREQGPIQGAMKAGSMLGQLAGGSGVLLLAGTMPWETIYCVVAILIAVTGTVVPAMFLRQSRAISSRAREGGISFPLKQFFKSFKGRTPLLALVFGLVAASGYTFFEPSFIPWFKGLGYTKKDYSFYLVVIMVTITAGALIGGYVNKRLPAKKSVVLATVVTALAYASVGILSPHWHSKPVFTVIITGTAFCLGFHAVSILRFFMRVTKQIGVPAASATVFAVFMAAINGSEAWAKWLGGWAAGQITMQSIFYFCGLIQLLSLIPVIFVKEEAWED